MQVTGTLMTHGILSKFRFRRHFFLRAMLAYICFSVITSAPQAHYRIGGTPIGQDSCRLT